MTSSNMNLHCIFCVCLFQMSTPQISLLGQIMKNILIQLFFITSKQVQFSDLWKISWMLYCSYVSDVNWQWIGNPSLLSHIRVWWFHLIFSSKSLYTKDVVPMIKPATNSIDWTVNSATALLKLLRKYWVLHTLENS